MNILFVCSGNISRSFLAEMLLKHELELKGLKDVSVTSAGLFAYPGNLPDPKIVDYLQKIGISAEGHEARQITKGDVDWADLILVMEREHAIIIERSWPEVRGKVELLGKFISGPQAVDDIIDPFGRSLYHYRLAQAQITFAVKSLVKRIISKSIRAGTIPKMRMHGKVKV